MNLFDIFDAGSDETPFVDRVLKVAAASVRGPRSPQSGFTLVELLVTVAILAFGCLAAVKMQVDALRGDARAEHLTVATFLAEAEMERLKSLTHVQIVAEAKKGPKVELELDRLGRSCASPPNCQGFVYKREVKFFSGTPTPLSHQVEIKVSWKDARGASSALFSGVMTSLSF